MRTPSRTSVGAAAALTALLALPGAGLAQDEMDTAMVRVLHASPDAPAVDVYADGGAILQDVPFGVISDYLEVPGGTYQIQVVPAGASLEEGPVVIDAPLTFEGGTMTTVAATNFLESIEAQVITDAPAPVAEGTQVRVVHFSADAPAVDIAVDGGDVVVADLAYPTATDYLDLPAGEYDLEIRAAGTTDVAFDIPALTLEAGNSYSAFAIGSLADGSFTVLATLDASVPAMAMVRVLHASPDAPAVDVYADGGAILQDVPFGVISDYLEVPGGTYQIQVVPAGASLEEGPVVIDAPLTFEGGTMTTVAATNFLESIEAQVITDAPAPVADEAQIRVVHLSADSPRVDIAPNGSGRDGAVVRNLRYGRATDYLTVPAGELDLQVRPAGERRAVFDIPALDLEAGNSYSAIAIGSLADGTFTVLATVDAAAA